MIELGDITFVGEEPEFPSEGDNFRAVPRSQIMAMAGQLDAALGLPERAEGDFVTHADWRNYLSGRRG